MSHPELSSGGGSSLSSGKLSKLLVSVGEATCGRDRVKEMGTVIRAVFGNLYRSLHLTTAIIQKYSVGFFYSICSGPRNTAMDQKILAAAGQWSSYWCEWPRASRGFKNFSTNWDKVGRKDLECQAYPSSPEPRIPNLCLQDPEFEDVSWASGAFEYSSIHVTYLRYWYS